MNLTNMFERRIRSDKLNFMVHYLKKLYYIFIFFLLIIVILVLINFINRSSSNKTIIQHLVKEHPIYNCCVIQNNTFRENIIFIKTHKTGSSTVQNVLFRFGERRNLTFTFPLYVAYYLPLNNFSLYTGSQTLNHKYNILASHVRYSSNIRERMYPDAVTVTILRNPSSWFESMYDYFCVELTTGLTLKQFLRLPIKPRILLPSESHHLYRGYNGMSYDLGLEVPYFNHKFAINEFIEKVDRELDFIMIMEYFEASMVLLANLMGWPLENVAYLTVDKHPYKKNYNLTEKDKLEILQLNYADGILYNHFLLKFRKCMKQYGIKNLNRDIDRLKMLNQQLKKRCVKAEQSEILNRQLGTFVKTDKGVLRRPAIYFSLENYSDFECLRATREPGEYEISLREAQRTNLSELELK